MELGEFLQQDAVADLDLEHTAADEEYAGVRQELRAYGDGPCGFELRPA